MFYVQFKVLRSPFSLIKGILVIVFNYVKVWTSVSFPVNNTAMLFIVISLHLADIFKSAFMDIDLFYSTLSS